MIETKRHHRQRGFTMIEMIGVLAVIAILASIVAPKIFDAIRDSKINAFASNVPAVQTAVASFYKDVGALPTVGDDLLSNAAASSTLTSAQKSAWKGPYIDKKVTDMFNSIPHTATTFVVSAPASTNNFDINGDGKGDYSGKSSVLELTFTGMALADAKAISGVLDGDDTVTANAVGSWFNNGSFLADPYTATATPAASATYHAFIAAF